MRSGGDLPQTLAEMATALGANPLYAVRIADAILDETCICSAEAAAEQTDPVERLPAITGQADALLQIRFGLGIYQDPDLLEELRRGADLETLLEHWDDAGTQEDPGAEILHLLGRFRVSDRVLRAVTKLLQKTKEPLFTAAEISETCLRFRCIAAMSHYLQGGTGNTPAHAAHVACTDPESGAAAEAVGRALLAENAAFGVLRILWILLAAAGGAVYLFHWLPPEPDCCLFLEELWEMAELLGMSLLTGGLLIHCLSQWIACRIGKWTAKSVFQFRMKKQN